MRLIDADELIKTIKDPPLHLSLGGMTIYDVITAIDELAKEQEWTPVSKKLPKPWKMVWAYLKETDQVVEAYCGTRYGKPVWYCGASEITNQVTHWRPQIIPDPPEVKE